MSNEVLRGSDLEVGATVGRLELDGVWAVDPLAGREGRADLLVVDGMLESLSWHDAGQPATGEGGDGGLVVAPGFTDLHAHFREPGFEDAETIASGQAAAAHGGFTTVCVMPNTNPPLDEAPTLRAVLARAAATGNPVRMLSWAAATHRREGKELAELGELSAAGAIGFSDDGSPIAPGLMRNALAYAGMLGRIVADHPEDRELSSGAEAHEGLVATVLGLKGWPESAEESAIARDIAILGDVLAADSPAARLHLTHVSTAGGVEIIRRAKAAGLPVTCDVTPHHLALTDEWLLGARHWSWQSDGTGPWAAGRPVARPYHSALRVNPPLRTQAHARALFEGLQDRTIDAVATDHAPHTLVDKEVEFGLAANGISGIETALGVLLEAVAAGELTLLRALEALTVGPARVLGAGADPAEGMDPPAGRPAAPTLRVGGPADLVLFDRADDWLVSETALLSLGKNSPLLGRRLHGRVLATVASGRLAYVDRDVS